MEDAGDSGDARGTGVAADRGAPTEIVVGVDGSPASWTALDWAARWAADHGLGLLVLHALNMPVLTVPVGRGVRITPTPDTADRAVHLLHGAVRRVAGRFPGVDVRTEVSTADPTHALLSAARRAALVVVGSRGVGGVASVFLGAVSDRVSAHASCPVAVIPASTAARTEGEEGGGRVVVGLDGSREAAAALRFALDEAAHTGAELVAVYAWSVPAPLDAAAAAAAAFAADREFAATRGEEHLRSLVEQARGARTAEVKVRIAVVEDHPAHALVTEGAGADLVVVGSRGRGGFTGLLLGSVSRSVLHHASGPVVVVRPRDGAAESG